MKATRKIVNPGLPAILWVLVFAIGIAFFLHLLDNPPPDFLAFYLGGKLAASGHIRQIYDPSAYRPLIEQLHQQGVRTNPFDANYFIRPAFQAYFYIPFSWFPYRTAATLALLFNFACLGILTWKLPVW